MFVRSPTNEQAMNVTSKLRSTMLQERLGALMVASVEEDILVQLSVDDLLSKFASAADRRLDLG